MLTALLWKDLRVNRLPLVIVAVVLVTPYVLVAFAVAEIPLWQEATAASGWALVLATGAYFSVMCSLASLAVLSGHLVAIERGDRSVEFIAYLPPSRWQLLASKGLVLAGAVVVVWGVTLGVGQLSRALAGSEVMERSLIAEGPAIWSLASVGALAMGAGWCASCMVSGTGSAVALAFLSPLLLVGMFQLLKYVTGWPDELSFATAYHSACWLLSAALFAIGTAYFLRRVEG